MINLKERIEIILNKTIKQVGLIEADRSNAVVIGYKYDEFGGIADADNQIIIEWNLSDKQPTTEQLQAITDSQIEEHAKKQLIVPACKQYLNRTDYKMTADYDKDTADIRIIREKCRELIRQIEDDKYPLLSDLPEEVNKIIEALDVRNKDNK